MILTNPSRAEQYERNTTRIVRITGLFSVLASLLITCTVIDTVYQLPPVKEIESRAIVKYINNFAVLEVSRTFNRVMNESIEINSVLRKDNHVIPLTHGAIRVEKELINAITLPLGIEGKYCIDADVVYSYRFSLRAHTLHLEETCIDIRR